MGEQVGNPPGAAAGAPSRLALAALVLALSLAFLAHAAPWLGARFGESHDGRNAATWAAASRAVREEGPVASRLGGRVAGQAYASHPPGIVVETTAAELLAGEHRLATRAPAWLGSVAALALLAALLAQLGLSLPAIAVALGLLTSSSMFLVYGTMLDTPVTSLPFAVAVVLVTQRTLDRPRPRPGLLAVVGALAALSGWLATLVALAQVVRLAVRSRAQRASEDQTVEAGPARRLAAPAALAGGVAAGVAISAAWILWVYGSIDAMTHKLDDKTSSVGLGRSLAQQWTDLLDLYPVLALIGVLGALAAVARPGDRRWRGAALSVAGPVLAYAVVFRGGAHMHDYWNFAVIVPLAIAAGAGAQVAVDALPRPVHPPLAIAGAVAGVALFAALLSQRSDGEARLVNALGTPTLLDRAAEVAPSTGPVLAYRSPPAIESPWVPYESRRIGLALHRPEDLQQLARRDPAFPVLVAWVLAEDRDRLRAEAYAVDGPYAVVPAAVAASG